MKTKSIFFLALFALFSLWGTVYGQVTMGMGKPPVKGALLQLKEQEKTDGSANSTKGLGLPRLKLTNINDLNDILPNAADRTGSYKDDYIGSIVYNTATCAGISVWTGVQWERLIESAEGSAYTDSLALIAFYQSTNRNSGLTNWGTAKPMSTWLGVTVENRTCGRVTKISLASKSLTGTIPAEMGNLNALTDLVLNNNTLSGAIPSGIGNLVNLTTLKLDNNLLTSVPSEISNLTRLTVLDMNHNQITSLPASIGSMTQLTSLNFTYNLIGPSIPKELANLTRIKTLDFTTNKIVKLPDEIGNMPWLTVEINFTDNLLKELPTTIDGWSGTPRLILTKNPNLTALPHEINGMTSLQTLYADDCKLTGMEAIPNEIGELNSKLTYINISNNPNLKDLNPAVGNVANLAILQMANCGVKDLPDIFVTAAPSLTALRTLDISKNPFTDHKLPDALNGNTSVTAFTCNGNGANQDASLTRLTDSPNDWFGATGLTGIVNITLAANDFNNDLPDQLQRLTGLIHLYIHSNSSLKNLKPWFTPVTFPKLATLNVGSSCPLTQTALDRITAFSPTSKLVTLTLNGDATLGSLNTSQIWNMTQLTTLNMSTCNLTGSIPTQIGNMTALKTLTLKSNLFTGTIPTQVENIMGTITSLDFSKNDLSGAVPPVLRSRATANPTTIVLKPQNGIGFSNY